MTTLQQPAENLAWYALPAEAAAGQMGVDPDQGAGRGGGAAAAGPVRAERASD
jgi:hypothetical protein